MKKLGLVILILLLTNVFSLLHAYEYFPPFDRDIYPIGWSEDGKFAYVVYKSFFDGYGAGTDFHFYLQDLVTNEIIANDELILFDTVYSIKEVMLMKKEWYDQLFSKYKIDRYKTGKVKLFPLLTEKDKYTIIQEEKTSIDNVCPYGSCLELIKITLCRNSDKLRKIIYEAKPDACFTVCAAKVIKSPFENRIAFILFLGVPGYEGIPLGTHITVVGFHLDTGFK
jgi:hypothetical protein